MNIIFFETIDSTNTYVKKNIDLLEDKTVVHTNLQTAGRGRFDRTWTNVGADNIYMTFVLKPSNKIETVYANLTQYLSVCLCELIEEFVAEQNLKYIYHPAIKWPNDVLLGQNGGKKMCGILAEAVVRGGELKGIALGIGINLNAQKTDLDKIDRPATALNIELGKEINKEEFMQKLIDKFFLRYEEFLSKGFLMIKKDYEKRAMFINQDIKIAIFDKIVEGKFIGFDNNCALLLEGINKKITSVNMGEII